MDDNTIFEVCESFSEFFGYGIPTPEILLGTVDDIERDITETIIPDLLENDHEVTLGAVMSVVRERISRGWIDLGHDTHGLMEEVTNLHLNDDGEFDGSFNVDELWERMTAFLYVMIAPQVI